VRILAMDTTTTRGSVAVVDGGEVVGEVRFRTSERHSSHAMPAVEFLLRTAGWRPADVEGYAVTTGPGSFTGLRVGLGTVQGLALASGRPCLGISALDVLARRIVGAAEFLVALVDGHRGQVYAALYDQGGRPLGEPSLGLPAVLLPTFPRRSAYVGDGALRYRAEIAAADPSSLVSDRSLFLAGSLALLASARMDAGETGTADGLRPLYLRGPDIRPSPR
jgi:tRNA threonylcarbamoyladenosine biosynthesis protein TsaB